MLPGYSKAVPYYIISRRMGAEMSQILIKFEQGGRAVLPAEGKEQAFFVEAGTIRVERGSRVKNLGAGGFGFIPADTVATLKSEEGPARITVFEKEFSPLPGTTPPGALFGNASEVEPMPFLGNDGTMLRTLLPADIEWDMAMNIFTYRPGATLPFVETHVMEHGMVMLEGQGIYRLEEEYYPVTEGDALWMAPYCPQWFVAMGDGPTSYLYYKNCNRSE